MEVKLGSVASFRVEPTLFKYAAAAGCCGLLSSTVFSWVRRSRMQVKLQFAATPTGFFAGPFGRQYYRAAPGGQLYEAIPDSAVVPAGGMPSPQTLVTTKFVPVKATDRAESLVLESPMPTEALSLPAYGVELAIELADSQARVVGMGTRVGDWLMTGRHVMEKRGKLAYGTPSFIVSRGGRSIRVDKSEVEMRVVNLEFFALDDYTGTWVDVAFYKLTQAQWAAVGAKSLKFTDISVYGEAHIQVYGRPGDRLLVSEGNILPDPILESQRGVFTHSANTVETYSGSPVVTVVRNSTKLVGMHVAGGDNVNYAITSKALISAMRLLQLDFVPTASLLSFSTKPLSLADEYARQSLVAESRENRRQFGDLNQEYLIKTKAQHRAERAGDMYEDEQRTGIQDHDGVVRTRQLKPLADRADDDMHYIMHADRGNVSDRAYGANLSNKGNRLWADMDDETLDAADPAQQEEAYVSWLSSLIERGAPQVQDGWVRRSGAWLFGRTRSNKIIASLEAKKVLKTCQSHGESWVYFPEPEPPASEQVAPLVLEYPVPSAPPKPTSSAASTVAPEGEIKPAPGLKLPSEERRSLRDQTISIAVSRLDGAAAMPLHVAAVDESLTAALVDCGEDQAYYEKLKPVPASSWPTRLLPFHNAYPEDHPSDPHRPALAWANHLKDARPPIAVSAPSPEVKSDIEAALAVYAATGDVHELAPLRGVGAANLIQNPWFAEFRRYLAAGDKKFWAETDQKPRNLMTNARGEVHALRVGTCARSFAKDVPGKSISPEFAEVIKKLDIVWRGENITDYVCGHQRPPRGPVAVLTSFRGQCARQKPGDWSRLFRLPRFLGRMKEFIGKYPATRPPLNCPVQEAVDAYCDHVDREKSAGWSARYRPGSKGAWTTTSEGRSLLAYLVMARLALRYAEGENIHFLSGQDMARLGLRDPEEVFVKDEGHCPKKCKDERWRLIWISSVVDSCCQDVLHHAQNKADIAAYAAGNLHVQAVGLGHHDDGITRLGETFDHMSKGSKELKCSDASGWDLSVCRDALYFDTERRVKCLAELDFVVADLFWAEAATNSTHVLVAGTALWSLTHFGVTASGIPSTSAQNSPVRSFSLEACGADEAMAAGDDEVHTGDVDESLLASTGCITKEGADVSGPSGPVSFTSHSFVKGDDGKWRATFDNFPKMLAALDLRREGAEQPNPDAIAGMRFALRHTPEADSTFCKVCEEMGWSLVPAAPLPYED